MDAENSTGVKAPSELARYGDLFQKMSDPVLLLDANSYNVVDANTTAEQFFDIPLEKLLGKSIFEFVTDGGQEPLEKDLRIARRRYYPRMVESRWNVKGAFHEMQLSCCMLELTNGESVMQVIARDITELKRAQAQAQEYQEKLLQASITDAMTGLKNFRHFIAELSKEHERCKRYTAAYSIVFMDLDNFKHYNDRNGHPAGDELLRQLAKVLQSCARNTDMVARYGGEEFAILCPETTLEQALVLGERIRSRIESTAFAHAEAQPLGKVSASIGISAFPNDGETHEQVLEKADQAAYASKRGGRNRVTLSSQLSQEPTSK